MLFKPELLELLLLFLLALGDGTMSPPRRTEAKPLIGGGSLRGDSKLVASGSVASGVGAHGVVTVGVVTFGVILCGGTTSETPARREIKFGEIFGPSLSTVIV